MMEIGVVPARAMHVSEDSLAKAYIVADILIIARLLAFAFDQIIHMFLF
jgi:hypothetical protein